MPARRTAPSPASSPHRIADIIYRSLATAVTEQCSRHLDAEVTVDRRERSSADQPMRVQIGIPDRGQVKAEIVITHVGGNVYDVRCEVEQRTSRRFTYSQPRRSGTALSHAPCLGQKLGTFLLDELEHHLGHRLLHSNEQSTAD